MRSTPAQEAATWQQARRERALRLLGVREQSLHELRTKLLQPSKKELNSTAEQLSFAAQQELLEPVIAWLLELDLQSDARFIDALATKVLRQGKGPIALQQEFRKHNLAASLVNAKLAALEPLWYQQIMRVREKRFGQQLPENRRQIGQMQRFLAQRGFPSSLIVQAVFLK